MRVAEVPLLRDTDESRKPSQEALSIAQLLGSPSLRPTALLVAFILAAQQLAGINAVLFYSTPVLKGLLPGQAGLISIGVTVVNALMTFAPLLLVDVSQFPLPYPENILSDPSSPEALWQETSSASIAVRHGNHLDPTLDRTQQAHSSAIRRIDLALCCRFRIGLGRRAFPPHPRAHAVSRRLRCIVDRLVRLVDVQLRRGFELSATQERPQLSEQSRDRRRRSSVLGVPWSSAVGNRCDLSLLVQDESIVIKAFVRSLACMFLRCGIKTLVSRNLRTKSTLSRQKVSLVLAVTFAHPRLLLASDMSHNGAQRVFQRASE